MTLAMPSEERPEEPRPRVAGLWRQHLDSARLPEFWSPDPIVGYRFWRISPEGLVGANRVRWPGPTLDAQCRRGGVVGPPGAPHEYGTCPSQGHCGINAFIAPEVLVRESIRVSGGMPNLGPPFLDGTMYGVVHLTGRVIQHDKGYRAERATVVAAVLSGPEIRSTTDPAVIAEAFAGSIRPERWDPVPDPDDDVRFALVRELRRLTDVVG